MTELESLALLVAGLHSQIREMQSVISGLEEENAELRSQGANKGVNGSE